MLDRGVKEMKRRRLYNDPFPCWKGEGRREGVGLGNICKENLWGDLEKKYYSPLRGTGIFFGILLNFPPAYPYV